MPLTVAVADEGDGTSTATIAGSSAGTVEVFTSAWEGAAGATGDWTSQGSRAGDGTLTLTLGDGYYWAKADETSASKHSVPYYWRQTSAVDAIMWQCLNAIQARLQGMTFSAEASDSATTIQSGSIMVGKLTWPKYVEKPGILITPYGAETMHREAGTNIRDDVDYSILVQIMDRDGHDMDENLQTFLKWREQIAKAFRNQNLVGVSAADVYLVYVTPAAILDKKTWESEARLFISSLVIHCLARETRGLS